MGEKWIDYLSNAQQLRMESASTAIYIFMKLWRYHVHLMNVNRELFDTFALINTHFNVHWVPKHSRTLSDLLLM